MNKLSGTLLYLSVQSPVKAYVEPRQGPKPDEWKASVAIGDEDVIDEFEEYVASVGAKVSIKKVKAADFTAKYKAEVPEGTGKNVWVVTFRKSTELGKTGKQVPEIYRPRVLERQGNTLLDITNMKLVGNGSKGTISIDPFERSNGTSSLYLKNILVTELVEYVPTESDYNPGDEFADEDDAAAEVPAAAAAATTTTTSWT